MKFNIELNVYELHYLMATGTFQTLCRDVQTVEADARKSSKAAPDFVPETKNTTANETVSNTEKEVSTEEAVTEISEVEIRAKFVELSKKGKKKELKDLLTAMGVEKVSDLKPEQYQEAWAKLEAI